MEVIIDYWYVILACSLMLAMSIIAVVTFLQRPPKAQVAKVKEWLLVAVLEAEKKFGSGTGQLKLRMVYDLFVARFPWMAKIVSFDTFAVWVDEALDTVEEWLKDDAVAEYVADVNQK